jgi:hypothetical protein
MTTREVIEKKAPWHPGSHPLLLFTFILLCTFTGHQPLHAADLDTDNDTLIDSVDLDDDGDGVPDAADTHPLDPLNGQPHFTFTRSIIVSEDAETRGNLPSDNYGGLADLKVRAYGTTAEGSGSSYGGFARIAYLKFDVQAVLGTVTEAQLQIYCLDSGSGTVEAIAVESSDWAEEEITYATAPPRGTTALGVTPGVTANDWTAVDITAHVSGNGIHSIALREPDNDQQRYSSRTGSHPPAVAVVYTTTVFDSDGDGVHNYQDDDDDNDGVPDAQDAFQVDPNDWLDTDGDGTGNNTDDDDDGDGTPDDQDDLPLDPTETIDTDGDGIGNTADTDDDGDGMPDDYETANGLDPLLQDGSNDADGDTYDNLYEYRAETDPQLPGSVPTPGFILRLTRGGVPITGGSAADPVALSEAGDTPFEVHLQLTHAATFEVRLDVVSTDAGEVHVAPGFLFTGDPFDGNANPWWQPVVVSVTGVDDANSDGDVVSQIHIVNTDYLNSNYAGLDIDTIHVATLDDEPFFDSDGDGVPDGSDDLPYNATETADSDGDGWGDNQDAAPSDPTRNGLEINLLGNPGAESGLDSWTDPNGAYGTDGATVHGGSQGFITVVAVTSSGDAELRQDVSLPPNIVLVHYGGWINTANTTSNVRFGVRATEDGSNSYRTVALSQAPEDAGSWQYRSSQYAATPGTPLDAVRFRLLVPRAELATYLFDDLELFAFTDTDTDGDTIVDYLDSDDDNDGLKDGEDPSPTDATPQNDFDNDGLDDLVDPDDDNDGVPDHLDAFDNDASRWQSLLPSRIQLLTSVVQVSELKDSDSFGVVLTEAPSADVTIPLTNPDPSEVSLSTSSLVFTPANWSVAQIVTVTGVDDSQADGDQYVVIATGAAQSADVSFDGDDGPDVMAANLDDRGYIVEQEDGSKTLHASLAEAQTFAFLETSFLSKLQIDEAVVGGNGMLLNVNEAGIYLYSTVEDVHASNGGGFPSITTVAHEGDGHVMFMGAEQYQGQIYLKTATIAGPRAKYMRFTDVVSVVPISQVDLPYFYVDQDDRLDGGDYLYFNLFSNFADAAERPNPPANGTLYYKAPGFMTPGQKYYSWDLHYFYDTPEAMYRDMIAGTGTNAVNADSILINRYHWRDVRVPSRYSIDDLFGYIQGQLDAERWQASMYYVAAEGAHAAFEKVISLKFNIAAMIAVSKTETGWGRSDEGWQDHDPFNHSKHVATQASVRILDWPLHWIEALETRERTVVGRKGVGIGGRYNGKTKWALTTASHYFFMDRELGFLDYDHLVPLYTIYGTDRDGDGILDADDAHPDDPTNTGASLALPGDADGDGFSDTRDSSPNDRWAWIDTDGDTQDNNRDIDDDGDGTDDLHDPAPMSAVDAVNVSPSITLVGDQSVGVNGVLGPLGIMVTDTDNDPADLLLAATASNQTLMPDAGILLSGLGENRTITLTPAAGQLGTATITVTVGDGTDTAAASFVLTVESAANCSYPLPQGWSMASLCGTPTSGDNSLVSLFPNALSLFRFSGGYQMASALDVGQGYWIHMPAAETVSFDVDPALSVVSDLPAGWSMVGGPHGDVPTASLQTAFPAVSSVFGFAGQYEAATALVSGQGYWLNMASQGQVTLAPGTASSPAARSGPLAPAEALSGPLLWVQSGANRQEIHLGVDPESITALPPPPPVGVLDARVRIGELSAWQVPEAEQERAYLLLVQGAGVVMGWDVPPEFAGRWELVFGDRVVRLDGAGELSVGSGPTRMKLRTVPVAYRLHANYPNPFNPSTTVRYDLKQDGPMSLRVYGITGQLVREVIAEVQRAGAHKVVWDGADEAGRQVSSGVYLVELRAGKYRAVRRIMLLK